MPNLTRNMTRLLIFAAIFSMGGCFSLSRGALPPQHYVLGSGGSAAAADRAATDRAAADRAATDRPATDAGPHVVGLRLPRLADYLASPFIVVRRGEHQVEFTEHHRWGEDLGSAINRNVAGLLAARAPTHRVVTAPWPGGTPPEQVIQLQILRFEGTAPENIEGGAGAAHLLATWEIFRASDGSLLARGTTEVREDGWTVGDFAGLVRLLDQGLRRLADDLAGNLVAQP
ncbi:MAG: membrane integrity-associated transporter subunit PqiC [Gemmatimonadales bacterium]|nr:MAG: membrane integrity-associated transporter subunit PqiC [Gemmatimonadales bacterium]